MGKNIHIDLSYSHKALSEDEMRDVVIEFAKLLNTLSTRSFDFSTVAERKRFTEHFWRQLMTDHRDEIYIKAMLTHGDLRGSLKRYLKREFTGASVKGLNLLEDHLINALVRFFENKYESSERKVVLNLERDVITDLETNSRINLTREQSRLMAHLQNKVMTKTSILSTKAGYKTVASTRNAIHRLNKRISSTLGVIGIIYGERDTGYRLLDFVRINAHPAYQLSRKS